MGRAQGEVRRLPEWLRGQQNLGALRSTKNLLRSHGLSTVCEEARCPNKARCFAKPTATFMILGERCTRNCGFCAVEASEPGPVDSDEPTRVAEAAGKMGLRHVVITSVTRDDLSDGGAEHFSRTIAEVRRNLPEATVEVLVPDFKGNASAVKTVLEAAPDVFNHNVETVPRLYPVVRPKADYARSLKIIEGAANSQGGIAVKSGLMVGLGESRGEVLKVLGDLKAAGCEILTIGQYLMPARNNLPVVEYLRPEVFEELGLAAKGMGFRHVASAPLVRSSMNAEEMYRNGV